ncbi:hydrogenase nickel incorporation protein HypB [Clostridium cavendishii DSM 21758]|uniref:Hydrogenase nickel incorporation protein HypB n=1 Tax=Clostridium cavendishii DSM 21758 TaxID=1121302 RepID=A0A1M6HXG2_9CLOT|nr:hydrogenase nickel incorporation protein HypB [Clostridium cavendishii]SHJ26754.1 hydrogenase nickel incorporation protein HypB [Clostridium cavendishii DSM 21758]
MKSIEVKKRILQSNTEFAERNRRLLKEKGLVTLNIFGSPGAGKTSILEKVIRNMKDKVSIGVIEGDLYTTKDGMRIEGQGIPVVQINTCGACHLDAAMVEESIQAMNIEKLDVLFIENIGNLVCPASYDLGEDKRITVLSITEGNDKPLKYPFIFKQSDAVVLNKMDIIEFTDFNLDEFYEDIYLLNKDIKVFLVSARSGEGISEFCNYLESKLVKNN